jgi:hypothetical protein
LFLFSSFHSRESLYLYYICNYFFSLSSFSVFLKENNSSSSNNPNLHPHFMAAPPIYKLPKSTIKLSISLSH